jgi:hypothetical protein
MVLGDVAALPASLESVCKFPENTTRPEPLILLRSGEREHQIHPSDSVNIWEYTEKGMF